MKESFGSKRPYMTDFEIAEELSPDPFSEEPHTKPHAARAGKSEKKPVRSRRIMADNNKNIKENEENGS